MGIRVWLVTLLVPLALIAGCAGGDPDSEPLKGSNASTPEPSPDDEAPVDENPTFGESFTFDDGLSVTISKPKPYRPTANSSLMKRSAWPHYIVFDVVIVNGTKQKFDPAEFTTTLQSKDKESEQVYDTPKVADPPTTTLLAGRQAKFELAYGVLDPADLVMDVDMNFEHETVTYTLN